ncbi:MAG: DUF3293 domain-containing protein [Halothiobacillaceae bacterium]
MSLVDAFTRTVYRIFLDSEVIDLRVGESSQHLARIIGPTPWIVFSPGNPGARRLSEAENAMRMDELKAWLVRQRLRHYPAVGLPPADQDWPPEASLLILDIPDAQAEALGARYGQLAWLAGAAGQASRLVWSSSVQRSSSSERAKAGA